MASYPPFSSPCPSPSSLILPHLPSETHCLLHVVNREVASVLLVLWHILKIFHHPIQQQGPQRLLVAVWRFWPSLALQRLETQWSFLLCSHCSSC
jgi:hypothetical protein